MTETVQVTNEDANTSPNKSNSKVLKLSNDSGEHVKSSDKPERPLTKVVVRHLPPTMTLESFMEQVSPLPPVDYMYFVKADSSLGLLSFSRAYLNFVNVQDLVIFTEKFDNYVFLDSKGSEYPAIVEYAPFQRIPKQRTGRKKDPRAGTIENDPYYQDFVEALKAEEAQRKSAPKTNKQHFFETNTSNITGEVQKVTSTPLLEYLKARRLDKLRVKEDKLNEKKKRELERKKAREERTAGRQGEGDCHFVKPGPTDRRSARPEVTAPAVSPTSDDRETKKPVRETPTVVKRREDDKIRARDRDRGRPESRDGENHSDIRSRENKRGGKSYQEERQRLNERRQAAKVGGSGRSDADAGPESDEGGPKELAKRPEKILRSPSSGLVKTQQQDPKKSFERARRPERRPVANSGTTKMAEPRDTPHKEEVKKKSYAQERELRRSAVKKDTGSSSSTATSTSKTPVSEKDGDSPRKASGGEKEKTDSGSSSAKTKDPRAERRIRNKDRPSIEIYRPGMGRFSRQRLEREKGSILGSSTERDSPSPSPSPSPSVSRAASVTAKPSSRPKSSEETAKKEDAADQSKNTADPPESTADPPECIADPPKSTADPPESTDDPPESTADPSECSADSPENTADPPEGTADSQKRKTADPPKCTADLPECSADPPECSAAQSEDSADQSKTASLSEGSADQSKTAPQSEDSAEHRKTSVLDVDNSSESPEIHPSESGDTADHSKHSPEELKDLAVLTKNSADQPENFPDRSKTAKHPDSADLATDNQSADSTNQSETVEHSSDQLLNTAVPSDSLTDCDKSENTAVRSEDAADESKITAVAQPDDSVNESEEIAAPSGDSTCQLKESAVSSIADTASSQSKNIASQPAEIPSETAADEPVSEVSSHD